MLEAIREISNRRLGMTCVEEADGTLAGIITDGDLRRCLERGMDLSSCIAQDCMVTNPVTVSKSETAALALNLLESRKITSLVVVSLERRIEGVLHLHDLWRTQLF
jgi:arabinose-5-phosphate isomerase